MCNSMAGIVDERLAAATGSRVNKIYQQTQVLARSQASTSVARDGSHVELVIHHGESVPSEDEKTASRLCLWWTGNTRSGNTRSANGLTSGSLVYVIVLIVMVASVFGLEVYRIRESSHLNQRINLLEEELEIFRHEFVETLKPNSNVGDIKLLPSAMKYEYSTLKAFPPPDIFEQSPPSTKIRKVDEKEKE